MRVHLQAILQTPMYHVQKVTWHFTIPTRKETVAPLKTAKQIKFHNEQINVRFRDLSCKKAFVQQSVL